MMFSFFHSTLSAGFETRVLHVLKVLMPKFHASSESFFPFSLTLAKSLPHITFGNREEVPLQDGGFFRPL